MNIVGTIIEVTENCILLQTVSKKQLIDIFFTPSKKLAVEVLFEPHMTANLLIEIQTVNVEYSNFAKLWLVWVQFPPLPDSSDLSRNQMDRYKKILPLYKT